MTRRSLSRVALLTAGFLSVAIACDRPGEPRHDGEGGGAPTSLADLPEGTNAVQHEMRLLDEAMRTTLTLLANRELEAIPAQILRVHPARQITEEAIAAGVYQPPKRPDELAEFQALDDAFHDDLKALLAAAERDDLDAATDAYADLVRGCTSCHQAFRF
jgi:hypothetical protein